MTKHFSKTLTRFISLSHKNMSSNSTDLSASPLLHPTPQPQISTSLAIQSVTPPTKKKESASFWFFAGVLTLGLGGANMLKHALVNYKCTEDRRKDLKVEPMKLNTTQDVDTLGHRRVVCKGVFDKQRSIYVGPKPRSVDERSEDGFYVITPLLPIPNEPDSMKAPILVNRGWVPLDWEETSLESMDVDVVLATANESRKANKLLSSLNPLSKFLYRFTKSITSQDQDPTTTHVEVVGVVRNNEFPSLYNVINYRRSLVWFFLDIPKLAQAMGFGEDTIYVEETPKDMDESRPYPVPRDLRVMLRTERKPLTYYPTSMLCQLCSGACFLKWDSIIMHKYGVFRLIKKYSIPGAPVLPSLLACVFYTIYTVRDVFCVIDTIGVGCFTKQQKDQLKDSIDLERGVWDT